MLSKEKHFVNLCANQWAVQPLALSKILGNVNAKLEDDKGEFIYNGYVMSEVLDSHVNRERTKFNLPEQANLVEPVGFNDIVSGLESIISEYLQDDIDESNKRKIEIIKDYIFNKDFM